MDDFENFPWLKSVFQSFSRTFPGEYSHESLKLLHMHLQKELKKALKNEDQQCLQKLFSCLQYLYSHFCWKIKEQKSYSSMKISCVKILSSLIHIGIILREKNSTFRPVNIILTALKIFPGTFEMLCDALLLLTSLKKHYYEDFRLILKQFLFTSKFDVEEPSSYFKALLLLRRLKFLSKGSFEKSKVISLAKKMEVPSHFESWLFENGIEHTLSNKSVANQFFDKKLHPSFFSQLRQVLQSELYLDHHSPIPPKADIAESLILDGSDVFKIDLERSECLIGKSSNANEDPEEINSLKINDLAQINTFTEKSFLLHTKGKESCSFVSNRNSEVNQASTIYIENTNVLEKEIIESVAVKEALDVNTELSVPIGKKNETASSNSETYNPCSITQTNLPIKSDRLPLLANTNKIDSSNSLLETNSKICHSDSKHSDLQIDLDLPFKVINNVLNKECDLRSSSNETFKTSIYEAAQGTYYSKKKENSIDFEKDEFWSSPMPPLLKQVPNVITKTSTRNKCLKNSKTFLLNTKVNNVDFEKGLFQADKSLCSNNSNFLINFKNNNLKIEINDNIDSKIYEKSCAFKSVKCLDNTDQEYPNTENQKSYFKIVNNECASTVGSNSSKDDSSNQNIVKQSAIPEQNLAVDIATISKSSSNLAKINSDTNFQADICAKNKQNTNHNEAKNVSLKYSFIETSFFETNDVDITEQIVESVDFKNTEALEIKTRNVEEFQNECEKEFDNTEYSKINEIIGCQTVLKNSELGKVFEESDTPNSLQFGQEILDDTHSYSNSVMNENHHDLDICKSKNTENVQKYEIKKIINYSSTSRVWGKEALDGYIRNILSKLVDEAASQIDNTENRSQEFLKEDVQCTSLLQKEDKPFSLQKITKCFSFSDVSLGSLEEKERDSISFALPHNKGDKKFDSYRDLLTDNISDSASNFVIDNEFSESDSEIDSAQSLLSAEELEKDIFSNNTNKQLVETYYNSLARRSYANVCEKSFDMKEAKIFVNSQPNLVVNLGERCSFNKELHCDSSFKTESNVKDTTTVLDCAEESKEFIEKNYGSNRIPKGLFHQPNSNLKSHSPLFKNCDAFHTKESILSANIVSNCSSKHVDLVESPIHPKNLTIQLQRLPFSCLDSTYVSTNVKPHINLRKRNASPAANIQNTRISKKRSASKVLENHDFNLNVNFDLNKFTLDSPPKKKSCKSMNSLKNEKEKNDFALSSNQTIDNRNEESKYIKSYNLRSSTSLIKPSTLKILK